MNKNIDFVNGNTKKCLLEMTVPMICKQQLKCHVIS